MGLPECLKQDVVTFEKASRAAAWAVPIPDDLLLVKVFVDHIMYVDARDRTISPHLATSYWESHVTLAHARTLKPGWYCLDVGSNSGYYGLLMGLAVGETGHVCAIEPVPRLASMIRWNFEINGLQRYCAVMEAAVSNTSGEEVALRLDSFRGCNSSIMADTSYGDSMLTVPTMTIDDITRDWPRCDFIKADVESAEELLWEGCQRTLARFPKLTMVLEVNTARYRDPEKFYRAIGERFPLRAIDPQGMPRQVTIEQLLHERVGVDSMLYLRRGPAL